MDDSREPSVFSTPENDRNLRGALRALEEQSPQTQAMPVIYHLDITGRCNLSCLYCQRDFFLKTKHPFLKGDMPGEVFDALQPYFREAKLVALLSMLGEPLLVKELPRWWVAVLEAGAKPQTTTNGSFLTPALADLFTSCGGRLKISVDTFDQPTLDVLRPRLSSDLLRERLALIEHHRRQHENPKFQLGVNVCVTAKNLAGVIQTMEECLRHARVDVFTFANFRMPRDEAGMFHRDASALSVDMSSPQTVEAWRAILRWCLARSREQIRFVFPYSRQQWRALIGEEALALDAGMVEDADEADVPSSSYYCCVPWLKVHVLSDGSVIPCHLLQWASPELVFGNVLETPFPQIWNGEAFRKFRAGMASGKKYSYCGQCNSWWRYYTRQRIE